MSAVIDAFQATCARIMLAFDGFLADVRGDGMLAYFGYPRAHEDDAERTVRLALDIAAAIARLKTRAEEPLSLSALPLPPAWWWSVARVHCGNRLWLGIHQALRPAFRP